jgi:hypothetical protein
MTSMQFFCSVLRYATGHFHQFVLCSIAFLYKLEITSRPGDCILHIYYLLLMNHYKDHHLRVLYNPVFALRGGEY